MIENWIVTRMQQINLVYDRCTSEKAIKTYLVSLKRMINEISSMDFTEFYHYEKDILYEPMKIFSEQFLEQVKIALDDCDSDVKKRKIILDLEDSLVRVISVFKNIVDSSANSDRQIFTNLSVESNVYNLSPKYCHFYSQILMKLVKIFGGENREYAFFLNPSIKYNTEFCRLLSYNDSDKRVLIIYLAESSLESIDVVPLYLLHEAFHILTRTQRERKLRALKLIQLMVCGIEQKLYEGVNITPEEKRIISDICFEGITNKVDEYIYKDEGASFFYSRNVIEDLCDYFEKNTEKLIFKTDAQIVYEYLEKYRKDLNYKTEMGFDEFNTIFPSIQNFDVVRKRAFLIIKNDDIRQMLELFMRIFREGYADLALLMVVPSPKYYQKAFESSIRFKTSGETQDIERNLRTQYAMSAIAQTGSQEYIDVKNFWEQWRRKKHHETQQFSNNNGITVNGRVNDIFGEYFRKCCNQLTHLIAEHREEVDKFRKNMDNIINNQNETVIRILSGDFFGTIGNEVS